MIGVLGGAPGTVQAGRMKVFLDFEASSLSDRSYIINNGHIVHESPAAELKANPDVLHRYLGV